MCQLATLTGLQDAIIATHVEASAESLTALRTFDQKWEDL